MPSCSNSSNISSAINSLNITQGSAGSRFFVQIDTVIGLTAGDVIRWDVPTNGYTASKADTPENSEVFGIIESYNPTTQKFNVVMGGSVDLSASALAVIPSSPTGGGGGNDIYFLSGVTAGKLQNLAPDNINHIIKPVYQVAPHGTYSGTIVNYSGYRLGGEVQGGLDTISALSKLGSVQLVFETYEYMPQEEQLLKSFGFAYNGTGVTPMFTLNPTTIYDWKLEHISLTDPTLVRYLDFKDFCDRVMPTMNGGWVERVKVDAGYTVTRANVLGRAVQQLNHASYDDSVISTSWYGQVLDYDPDTRYLFILRPAFLSSELITTLMPTLMAETSVSSNSGAFLNIMTGDVQSTNFGTVLQTVKISETNTSIQLFGFVIPSVTFTSTGTGTPEAFYFQTIYDPFNQNVYETTGVSPKLYMRIKNRGISLVVPDNVTVTELSSDTITLATQDLQTLINNLTARISCLESGSACP